MHGSNADNMGMLATTINSVAIHDCFETLGVPSVIMTATPMPKIGDLFVAEKAVEHMKEKKIVIICGRDRKSVFYNGYCGNASGRRSSALISRFWGRALITFILLDTRVTG